MTTTEFERRAILQNGYDRTFDNWKIIDIHLIPTEFTIENKIDFYCSNGTKVYLLRIRSRKNEVYNRHQGNVKLGAPPYLVAEVPIKEVNDAFLKKILDKFNL